MKIKIIRSAPWMIGGNVRKFVEGQTLEVGVDVPDAIAEDMLRCEYAEKSTAGRPRIETKEDVEPQKVWKSTKPKRNKKGDK